MATWLAQLLLMKKLNIAKQNQIKCETEIKDNFGTSAFKIIDDPTFYNSDTTPDLSSTDNLFLSSQKLCRLCMSPAQTSLFQSIGGYDVPNAIRVVTNLSVELDDSYPKYVCSVCIEELKSAFTFKRKCQETDMKYRQLSRFNCTLNPYPNFVRHDFNQLIQKISKRRTEVEQETARKRTKLVKKEKISRASVKMKRTTQFVCIACDMAFCDRERLESHRQQRMCVRRPCPVCRKLVFYMQRHMHRMHVRGPRHKCEQCGREYRTLGLLKSHMHVHSDRFDYKCEQCPYRGKQRAYLQLHMRTHTGERPYLCSQCPATFVNCSNLRKHTLVHANKQFQCTKCNKYFRLAKTLRDHDEAAHKQIRHPCNICEKIFTYRSRLLRHELRVHNREKHKLNPSTATQVVVPDSTTVTVHSDGADTMGPAPMTFLDYKNERHIVETTVNADPMEAGSSEIVVFECA